MKIWFAEGAGCDGGLLGVKIWSVDKGCVIMESALCPCPHVTFWCRSQVIQCVYVQREKDSGSKVSDWMVLEGSYL